MRITFWSMLLILLLFQVYLAQNLEEDLANQNGWKNFNLNSATTEEILKELDKPKNDKIIYADKLTQTGWSPVKQGDEIRNLKYKNIKGYESVEFHFLENRLVAITLVFDKNAYQGLANKKSKLLPAKEILEIYNRDFVMIHSIPKDAKISDYEGQKETTVPKIYRQQYALLGITADNFILVSVNNTTIKTGLKEIFNKPTLEQFPGFVQTIQIVSRK